MLRAAARSVIVSRCVRGIDGRGLHNTNLEALRTALLGVARTDASASSTASPSPSSASSSAP